MLFFRRFSVDFPLLFCRLSDTFLQAFCYFFAGFLLLFCRLSDMLKFVKLLVLFWLYGLFCVPLHIHLESGFYECLTT